MLHLNWVTSTGELLLWSQLALAWTVVNYRTFRDATGAQEITGLINGRGLSRWGILVGVRVLALGLFVLLLAGVSRPAIGLAALTVVLGLALPVGRVGLANKARNVGAEWEILLNLTFFAATAWIIGAASLELVFPLFTLPLSSDRITVGCLGLSGLLFSGRGGTHIVRGILDKVGTLPRASTGDQAQQVPSKEQQEAEKREELQQRELREQRDEERAPDNEELDTTEYNRGRIIGNLERLVLMIMVALGAYEALAFLVAAKGLIRIKQFENRDFAEYFLIGTLTSVTLAFVLGWVLRTAVLELW